VEESQRALASRAAERLAAAGQRASMQGDMPAAATLLWRAAALYPARDPRRVSLLPALGQSLFARGAWELAQAALEEAVEFGDPSVAAEASVALRSVRAPGAREEGRTP
jgi:uncharacterized protein HemY